MTRYRAAVSDQPTTPPVRPPAAALDRASLAAAVDVLAARDPGLAGIAARHGVPPMWGRPPGFETLVRIILEQQVSLRSGAAALERLVGAAGVVTPAAVLDAGEERLRAAGLTRQKARYLVALAEDVRSGALDLEAVAAMEDDAARSALMRVVGIGRWTADIYLLMALLRPDVWPIGDLALAAAMRRAVGLERLPGADDQARIADGWRPYRSVAARLLWQAYLAGER